MRTKTLVLLLLALVALCAAQTVQDVDSVRKKMLADIIPTSVSDGKCELCVLIAWCCSRDHCGPGEKQEVRKQMDALRADGSWADVNYRDQDRVSWLAMPHIDRLKLMARVLRSPAAGDLYNSSALLGKSLSALSYWYKSMFQNPNW